jgi:type IV secretory pathway TrbD component
LKKEKSVTLHRSLTEVIMIGGIPRASAILTWTIALAMGLGLRSWYAIPLGIFLHAAFYVLAKHDTHFLETFTRHFRYKRYLNP